MNQREAIQAFWTWWPSVAEAFASSFKRGGPSPELVDAMVAHVNAIDARLDWEFGPGVKSTHHLCLSGKGDPVLRVVAERWLRASQPCATWEFYSARQGSPSASGLSLRIAGFELLLSEVQFVIEEDETRELLDVVVDHPVFPQIEDETLKSRVAFIALDNALGEDDVERWIGKVEVARPTDAREDIVLLPALRSRVDAFAKTATGERWVLLRGNIEGAPVLVATNRAIKRIDHLLLDTHVTITIPIARPDEHGFPMRDESADLDAMQDALIDQLGVEVVVLGRETSRGLRQLHLHVMEGGPAAAIVERWRAAHRRYSVEVAVERDPAWQTLHRWG